MTSVFGDTATGIPTNKFYPAPLDPAHHLFRASLVRHLGEEGRRLILIEARAGQGKSTLAAQYLSSLTLPAGWYQVGAEDGDPVRFLAALLACLTNALPGFSSPLLAAMVRKGEINASESLRYLDILCADLDPSLTRDFSLVFDDVHLLEEHPHSLAFLAHFIATAPPRLRFVLTSRRPVLAALGPASFGTDLLVLDNEALGVSEEEVFTLYNDVLHIPVSQGEVRQLHRSTEGWIMGVVLASQELGGDRREGGRLGAVTRLKRAGAGSLADYFRDQIFPRLGRGVTRTLCRLSLLSTIPVPLAEAVSESPDIAALLADLAAKNYFVRPVNDVGTEFALHHLFQEALRLIAAEELTAEERREVCREAGTWYFHREQPEEALRFYALAGDYPAMERVLERDGLFLLNMNRTALPATVLRGIPPEITGSFAHMAFFYGTALMTEAPPRALSFLEQALARFVEQGDERGGTLARTQLVFFHLAVDVQFNLGLPLLEELEQVFDRSRDDLDVVTLIRVANTISHALIFLKGEIARARRYSDIALRLARDCGMENLLADIYLGRSWGCFPHWEAFRREIEEAAYLLRSPAVNAMNRMLLLVNAINLLEMEGDFENYRYHEGHLLATTDNRLLTETLSYPFLVIWRIDMATAAGNHREALDLVRQGLALPLSGYCPHLRSQFLHYLAYLKGMAGDREEALAAVEESLALRAIAGGKMFVAMNEMIVGGALAVLDMAAEAEEHLERGVRHSRDTGEEFFRAGAYAHRAALRFRVGREEEGRDDLRECLRCLAENGYPHFFSWTPALMRPLLCAAVAGDIFPDYARKLARERLGLAILPDGSTLPLMTVRTLGGLTVSLGERTMGAEEFTPAMRQLLSLLLSVTGLAMGQEEIVATLWPEIPAARARSRFDTLLLELRRALRGAFPDHDPGQYLVLKRGMLCLQHCTVDAMRFATLTRKGLAHVRKREPWQAGNCFHSASLCWNGPFLSGLRASDHAIARGAELDTLYQQAVLAWSGILSDTGRLDECIDLLAGALRYDRTHDALVKALYRAYLRNNHPALANQLVRQYEDALRATDFEAAEIAEALEAVWDENDA